MFYRGEDHAETFEFEASFRPDFDNRYTAALYLLTADTKLWWQVRDHFGTRAVLIGEMRPRRLSGEAYVFYLLARELLSSPTIPHRPSAIWTRPISRRRIIIRGLRRQTMSGSKNCF